MDDQPRRHGGMQHYPQPPFIAAPKAQRPGRGLATKARPRPEHEARRYRPAGKLEGKVALVSGGGSGLGRAVAALYAREGADVAIVYLPEEQSEAQQTQQAVERAGRRCLLLPGDVADPGFCAKAVERAVRELGGLHILVNNTALRASIDGCFYLARAALRHMKERAAIVNCGQAAGAVAAFTKSLAQNLVRRDIRVNCAALGTLSRPEEMAPAFVFLASEADSSCVTGQTLSLAGGEI